MKLLDEITYLLSDKRSSLTDALLKTKVLMHKIGHNELVAWVNDELNGYEENKPVPSYRKVGSLVMGNIQTMTMIYGSQPLPTGHLPEHVREYLHKHEMRESISVLEEFVVDSNVHLTMPLPPEYYKDIGAVLNGGWVQRAWLQMEPTQIMHGLTEIRSRLLDFVLGLQDMLGDIDDSDVKEAAKKVDAPAMFQHMVIGDNATIVVGNGNITSSNIGVMKGDFASLAMVLRNNGVGEEDISDLQNAVDQDSASIDSENKQFGPAVKDWMSKMMRKVIDTSWQIELGIAGGLLTEALKAYYF